jgi:hypothetical protein
MRLELSREAVQPDEGAPLWLPGGRRDEPHHVAFLESSVWCGPCLSGMGRAPVDILLPAAPRREALLPCPPSEARRPRTPTRSSPRTSVRGWWPRPFSAKGTAKSGRACERKAFARPNRVSSGSCDRPASSLPVGRHASWGRGSTTARSRPSVRIRCGAPMRPARCVKGHPNVPNLGHRKFPTRVRWLLPFPPVARAPL